jgi:hypothetical protein
MNEKEKPHPLLQKPLFIYSLPTELLNTITLKCDSLPPLDDTPGTLTAGEQERDTTGPPGCVTCNISAFADVSQQREHVRSDLHKFNLKRKLAGQKVVAADEFDKMLDGTPSSNKAD